MSIGSPWFYSHRNYVDDLGGVTRNSTGHVVAATTVWVQMLLEVRYFVVESCENGHT